MTEPRRPVRLSGVWSVHSQGKSLCMDLNRVLIAIVCVLGIIALIVWLSPHIN